MMSSVSKAPSTSEVAQESGWTTYFEDFFNGVRYSISSGGVATSSLLSDAASLAATKKLADDDDNEFSGNKDGKRLSFKKRKKDIANMVDDALEDTASSPLNCPKDSCAKQSHKPNQTEQIRLSQKKGSTLREESKDMGHIGRDSDCTELKKRGLCLVPLSVAVNFFG